MKTEVTMTQFDIEETIALRFGVTPEKIALKCVATEPNKTSISCVVTLDNPKMQMPTPLPHLQFSAPGTR